jgi:tripartite ATP-independent transporter DctM subunit
MLKQGYDKHLSYGAIMAGGCLGVLIPPSVQMVVYASLAEQSVGRMLLGGLFPGLVLSTIYILYIGIRTASNPSLGPGLPPEERVSWSRKLAATKSLLLPILVVLSVLGAIFLGIATPTEAGAVGCIGVLICAAVYHRLNWQLVKEVVFSTLKIFGMVFWVLVGAACFNQFYLAMGAASLVKGLLAGVEINPWIIVILMQVILILLGMVMEDLAIMVIAAPIFTPVVISLGFDPLWFGVIFVVNMQIAMLTPPFGFANFYMKGLLPEENMAEFYRSTYPFVGLQIIGLSLCMAFPSIILWLPNMMLK